MARIPEEIRKVERPPNTVVIPAAKDGRYPVREKIREGNAFKNGRIVGYISGDRFEFKEYGVHYLDRFESVLRYPISTQSFRKVIEEGMEYVDKTMLISQIIDRGTGCVHIYTRPTRFGKSLNLDMLGCFFDINDRGKEDLFRGLDIEYHPLYYRYAAEKNSYPVIRLNMRSISTEDRGSLLSSLRYIVANAYIDAEDLILGNEKCARYEQRILTFIDQSSSDESLLTSISELSTYLFKSTGKASVILMDEYDAFIQGMIGADPERFESIVSILANFMISTFKDNRYLSYGVITGIMRMSQTGIISGLNNAIVHDIFDRESAEYFGYTEDEVGFLLRRASKNPNFDSTAAMDSIRRMYDGYEFGGAGIYNPRSINMFLDYGDLKNPKSYWEQRSDNPILNRLLDSAPESVQNGIADMIEGRSTDAVITPSTLYSDLGGGDRDGSRLLSVLVMTGYLKASVLETLESGYRCLVSLPNGETRHAYDHLLERVRDMRGGYSGRLVQAIADRDADLCGRILNFNLGRNSIRDRWGHDDCKKWLLALLLSEGADASSEREAGNGYPDITVKLRDRSAFVEITTSDETGNYNLERLAEMSVCKAEERRYASGKDVVMAVGWDRKYVSVLFP